VLDFLHRRFVGYFAGVLGVLAVALVLWPFYPDVRVLTAANSLLIVVLLVAVVWGTAPALLSSVLGALYLNYFYVPPLLKFDFHIDGTEDVIGLAAFLITSFIVGHLSARSHQRARDLERLYRQLQAAFDKASQVEGIRRNEQFKSTLLDTVTHDLRTPLTSIKAAAGTLIGMRNRSPALAADPAAEEKLLAIIVRQSGVLNRFIEGMIEWAEIESAGARDPKNAETIPMDEIIMAALARSEDALRAHQVEVECEENLSAAGNAKAISQVLFSLLENAGKYAPMGTTVRVTARRDGPERIRIAVEDEGPGIPMAIRGQVFDKFFRGDAANYRVSKVSGLGLGLAIARRIVETQGGKIWIEERLDGKPGARFVFTQQTRVAVEPATAERLAAQ
jgi:K+-sensing histidine kinase KdpD